MEHPALIEHPQEWSGPAAATLCHTAQKAAINSPPATTAGAGNTAPQEQHVKNAASVSDAPATDDARNGGKRGRRNGDSGGMLATVTFVILLAVALGLLGYMVVSG